MLPHFLVIGAMKAGTTTLYEDLRAHSSAYLAVKESASLNQVDIATLQGRASYARLFRDAMPTQRRGEVSATYAKLPESEGVTERAATVLGNGFQVVYLVRNPVDRVVSHHHHEVSRGINPRRSIDAAVHDNPRLLNYTRYFTQIKPWVELLGAERVRIVQFEKYASDRAGTLNSILDFLQVSPRTGRMGFDGPHNVSTGLRVAVGPGGGVARSSSYRRLVRPWLPDRARRLGARILLPAAPPRPATPSPTTVEFIIQEIQPDLQCLGDLGLASSPTWDLEATKHRYREVFEQAHRHR